MTQAGAFAAPARHGHRITAVDIAAFAAGVLMILIFSQGWFTALTGGGDQAKADSGIVRAMYFPAYAAGLGMLAVCAGDAVRAALRQPLLIVLLWVVGASAIWSIEPDETLRRVVALVLTTVCAVVMAARFSWAALAEVMATAFAILAVGSLLAAVLVPSFGIMPTLFPGAWRGLWTEKNDLGGNMTLGFIVMVAAAVLQPRRALLWWPLAGLALLLVLMSTSKTSLVACALGVCGIALVALIRRGPAMKVAATYGAVVSAMLLGMGLLVASDVFLAFLGKDATLTGRTKIWSAVMTQIQLRPWLGYGYAAIWQNESPWAPLAWITKQAGFRAYHSHNSWLEQWLGEGLIGLVAWAGFFLMTWTRALIALYRDRGAFLAVPFLLVYSMTSLTESIAVVYNDMRWLMFVAIAVKLGFPDPPPARAPIRRSPSPTLTTSAPPERARSIRRSRASGAQPKGEGVWPTSWV